MLKCKKFTIKTKTEMRKYLFLALLIIACSCSQKSEKSVDGIVVNFKVENMSFAKVTIANKHLVEVVNLDKNGEGTCILQQDIVYASLYYGEESKSLFLQKGDNLTISFNGSEFGKSIQFTGESAPILEYINSVSYPALTPNLLTGSFDEIMTLINNRTDEATAMLQSSNLEQDFPQYVKLEKERIKYLYAANLIVYPMVRSMEDSEYRPDAEYFSVLGSYMKEDESLLAVPTYRSFLIEASLLLASRDNEGSRSSSRSIVRIEYIAKNFKNDKVKESLINEIAIDHIMWDNRDNIPELKELHNTYVTNAELRAKFDELVNN